MRNQTRSERRIPWRLWLLCGTTLALFGAAAPASADSNFERGFERELGRILAHEAVNAGKAVLFQGVVQPYAYGHGRVDHVHYDDRRVRRHYRQGRHDRQYQRWLRQQRRHHHRVGHPRFIRHGYYDDYDDRRGRKHRKHRRQRRYYDDDCDD